MNWSVLPILVDVVISGRHPREQPLAGERLAGRERLADRVVALRRDVGEGAARPDDAAVEPSKICVGFPGLTTISCWSGWIPFGACTQAANVRRGAPGAVVSCASFVRSVNVRSMCTRRQDRPPCSSRGRTAVRAAVAAADALRVARQLAVLEGADHVDRVRQAGRRVDVLVVPALRRAEVVRREVRARRRLRRQLLPAVVGSGTVPGSGAARRPAACDASSAAAGWSALSVRQKLARAVWWPPLAVPSVR